MARRKAYVYRVAYPAELLFDVRSGRSITDQQVRARAEKLATQFLNREDGCDILGEFTEEIGARVYVLRAKAYRETDGKPGDFAVADMRREPN